MHWSLRNTMLAIILPLTIAILAMSAAQIADLVAVRKNIEGFRDSGFAPGRTVATRRSGCRST